MENRGDAVVIANIQVREELGVFIESSHCDHLDQNVCVEAIWGDSPLEPVLLATGMVRLPQYTPNYSLDSPVEGRNTRYSSVAAG